MVNISMKSYRRSKRRDRRCVVRHLLCLLLLLLLELLLWIALAVTVAFLHCFSRLHVQVAAKKQVLGDLLAARVLIDLLRSLGRILNFLKPFFKYNIQSISELLFASFTAVLQADRILY